MPVVHILLSLFVERSLLSSDRICICRVSSLLWLYQRQDGLQIQWCMHKPGHSRSLVYIWKEVAAMNCAVISKGINLWEIVSALNGDIYAKLDSWRKRLLMSALPCSCPIQCVGIMDSQQDGEDNKLIPSPTRSLRTDCQCCHSCSRTGGLL